MLTMQQQSEFIGLMVETARRHPDRAVQITDTTGAVVGEFRLLDLPKRPKDMPRRLRPKERLSKRQRAQAKREKLAAAA
jgi:hypothetical protein